MSELATIELALADHARILQEHGKRIGDCESASTSFGEYKTAADLTIAAMRDTIDALQQNDKTQQELIVLFKLIIKLLGWVGTAARWIGSIGAAFAVLWAFFKE